MVLDVLQGKPIVIGADINAKSEMWHSSEKDERGELFVELPETRNMRDQQQTEWEPELRCIHYNADWKSSDLALLRRKISKEAIFVEVNLQERIMAITAIIKGTCEEILRKTWHGLPNLSC
ncbi:hypothetical protein PR048_004151 [Dryococelus australis]|uniref:Endonuclease/exonuclease/phosphatase domain-containing protein n=1 Tax=Dryococelus australis TaxID=614101 RepID=A0ABQ9I6L6_9NEOP|nr:hypothetical protein PR048_004151 [Dryococelus australis]